MEVKSSDGNIKSFEVRQAHYLQYLYPSPNVISPISTMFIICKILFATGVIVQI